MASTSKKRKFDTNLNARPVDLHQRSPSPNANQPINWHDNVVVPDVHVPWLYEAHSVLLLAIVVIAILYCCLTMSGSPKLGLELIMFLFIALGCLTFPSGPLLRPHPILWRLLFSFLVMYAFFIVYLLAQEPDDARSTLAFVFDDPVLGVKPPERNYAVDCRFVPSVVFSCFDRFIIAHFLGWAAKAMVLRSRLICWIISVSWELVELSTKYFIPNFAECWWDHIILDLALCNGLGIELGLWISSKWYDWDPHGYDRFWLGPFERYSFPTLCGQFQRLCIQFTPFSVTPMYWEPLSSIKRYFAAHVVVIAVLLIDFNAFTLKLFLYVPTEHSLNVWRLVLVGIITHEKCKKMGSFVWLGIVILLLEFALAFKCAPPLPSAPQLNKVLWTTGFGFYLAFTWTMLRDLRHVRIKTD